jgi:polyhydroxyalkanoate synthesis repressor PhaR
VSEPRLIKKYPNRRLYDTEESRYIKLVDVETLVRAGAEIKVIDSQSGEDITRSILIQIITEQENGGEPLFTTEMLTRFIRFYDQAVHGTFSAYLDQSLRFFGEQQRRFEGQLGDVFGKAPAESVADLTRQNLAFWQDLQESFIKAAGVPVRRDADGDEKDG